MNTKSLSTKMYLALSVLITGIMGLAGCGVIKFAAEEAKAGFATPADVEEVGVNVIETGYEPIGSPEAPAPTEQPPTSPGMTLISRDDELIRAELGAHLGVDGNDLAMAVLLKTGSYARGNVENGYFIAAKLGEEWVIVADGQGMPDCDKVERFGFPTSMVPECEFPTGSSGGSDEEDIRAALAAHFGVDGSTLRIGVKQNTGSHARGGVDNGYFLAAKFNGQWVFVDGGHAAPNCNEVAKYGFPASMVPECTTRDVYVPDSRWAGKNIATFLGDITIPDGSIVSPGQRFIKVWRIKNVGTCTWNENYQIVFESGDAMSGPAFQSLTEVQIPPGKTLDISLALTAPDKPGTYRGNWKFRGPYGEIFGLTTGNPVWVEVKVME